MPGGGPRGGGIPAAFGQDEYYLAFVGTPSVTNPTNDYGVGFARP